MAELSVRLTADIARLEADLNRAKKRLAEVGGAANKTQKALGGGAKGISAVGKSSANATPALQEFSRVIQDAPFGIQGVGNNIQQLTANFGNLSKSAGGTVPALKAMFGALAGPGGILLAVSAITSLLTVYGDKLFKTTSLTKEIAKATGEFVSSAQTEIIVLRNLISIANDENVAKFARERAIKQINEKYGEYLGNLDLESIKTQEVKEKVDALTNSLLNQAKVRGIQAAIEKRIGDSGEEFTELLLKQRSSANAVASEVNRLIDNVAAFNKVSKSLPLTEQIKELQNIVNRSGGAGAGLLGPLSLLITQFNSASKKTKEFSKEFEKDIKPLESLLKGLTLDKLISDLDKEFEVTVKAKLIPKEGKKLAKLYEGFIPPNLSDVFGLNDKAIKEVEDKTKFVVSKFLKTVANASKFNPVPALTSEIEDALLDFNQRADEIIKGGITDTFAGIGEAIGQSLIDGGNVFSAIGKTLLSSLGGILVQLGTMAIGIGVGLKAIKASLLSLNPAQAIGAGIALVALGSAFKAASGSLGGRFGGGGGGGGSQVAGQGSTSFSGGSASSFAGGDGTVVFEIEGQKLVGVLSRTLGRNARLGGNLSLS